MELKTIRCRDAAQLVGKWVWYVPVINGASYPSKAAYHHVTGFTRITPYSDEQAQIVLHSPTGDSGGYWEHNNVFAYYDTLEDIPEQSRPKPPELEAVQGALF